MPKLRQQFGTARIAGPAGPNKRQITQHMAKRPQPHIVKKPCHHGQRLMVYILAEIVTKLIVLPKYQQFRLIGGRNAAARRGQKSLRQFSAAAVIKNAAGWQFCVPAQYPAAIG